MLQWVEQVLKPYILEAPAHVVPLLLLDSYRCHMMASVVTRINELGVEVQHIPGGCTGLCQPVDVGVAKPLKDKLKDQWELWMIEEVAGRNGALPLFTVDNPDAYTSKFSGRQVRYQTDSRHTQKISSVITKSLLFSMKWHNHYQVISTHVSDSRQLPLELNRFYQTVAKLQLARNRSCSTQSYLISNCCTNIMRCAYSGLLS